MPEISRYPGKGEQVTQKYYFNIRFIQRKLWRKHADSVVIDDETIIKITFIRINVKVWSKTKSRDCTENCRRINWRK